LLRPHITSAVLFPSRGQERQVHLLRLPLPAQARQRYLQDPQAQREELRGVDR